jgi:hypothetical protein
MKTRTEKKITALAPLREEELTAVAGAGDFVHVMLKDDSLKLMVKEGPGAPYKLKLPL